MSDRRNRPLGQKIVAAILGTTLIALVLTFVMSIVPTVYMYRLSAMDRASAQAELLKASLAAPVDFDDPAAAQESLDTLSFVESVTGATVYLADGSAFASYGTSPARQDIEGLVVDAGVNAFTIACPVPSDSKGCVLVMEVSFAEQWSLLESQSLISLAVLLVVLAVCCKLAGMFRKRLVDPLRQLTGVVSEISGKKAYSRRVDYASDDEIGVLVEEFNAMLERVERRDEKLSEHQAALESKVLERTMELRRKQLELVRNNDLLLSEIKKRAKAEMIREEVERINRHDLKSGLSLVIGYPELLLNEGKLDARQQKHVKRIRAAGYRMLDMIRNQLDIFKMEKGIYSLREKTVDAVEVIVGLEEEFRPVLESQGISLSLQLDGQEVVGDEMFTVFGDNALIRTMFRNLIQNGIEASDAGDTVTVQFDEGGMKSVSIRNSRPVPEDVRRRFFDKYVTEGKENGTGLGTYFAALIARTHGANITMKTDEEAGTVITVFFRNRSRGEDGLSRDSARG